MHSKVKGIEVSVLMQSQIRLDEDPNKPKKSEESHFKLVHSVLKVGRSQLPYELSSLARTLASCVRIPFKACMFAFIVFVLSCVGSGLATGLSLVQGDVPTVLGLRN
jgi:hypothetical protein